MDQLKNKSGKYDLPESNTSRYDAGLFGDAPPAVPIRIASDPLKPAAVAQPQKAASRFKRLAGLALLVLAITSAGIITYLRTQADLHPGSTADASARYALQPAPTNLSGKLAAQASPPGTLTVNGQLDVADSLTLAPTVKPVQAQPGQLYYDQATSKLGYYNGTSFVYLQAAQGASTVNNITNVTNSNVTNVAGPTNVTNVSNTYVTNNTGGGGLSAPGATTGTLAMFAGPTTLADSLLSQNGSTLTTAGDTLQGSAPSGLNVLTSNAAGVTGALTLESGNSQTDSSGTVTLDSGSGVINGTIIEDYTFETGLDGFDGAPYGTAVAQTNAAAHTGSFSLAVPLSPSTWASTDIGGIAVTPGHEYRWAAWVRAATASAPVVPSIYFRSIGISSPTTTTNDTSAAWTEISGVFVDPAGNTSLDIGFVYQKNATETHYIDDITLTDLNTFTGLNVNVGTTNAQAINIGNANQAGDTVITGGTTGVKIKDATGDVSLNSGGAVNIAAGTDSSFTTIGNLLLQGGSAGGASAGGININTTPQTGSTGSISIQTGDSSTTASGNVTIDSGASAITGTVVGTKDFETGTDAMVDAFGFNDTVATTNTQAHSGAQSLQITTGTTGYWSLTEQAQYTIPAVAGHSYHFSAWVRAATVSRTINFLTDFSSNGFGGGGSTGTIQWGTGTDNAAGWTQISGTLVAPAATNSLGIWANSSAAPSGEIHYIDDITVTDLSSSAQVSSLNLGTTNAQSVTLGNANELGPTSVFGSGLTLNGGLGNTSLTGGAVNIFGQGNSQISSAGALTVTSSNSASWGILPSGFAGGSLTLHAGAGGGVSNGGDLVLQSGQAALGGVNGNITVDAPSTDTVSGTIVDQRGFETGTENMTVTQNTTVAQTNMAVHSGNFSLESTTTSAGPWQISQDQTSAGIPVTAGHEYYFSAWVRAGATDEQVHSFITWLGQGTLTLNPVTESGITWEHITGTGIAPAGTTAAYWNFYGSDAGGIIQLFDDLWVTDLSTATSLSALNLGANYIQSVNIGNDNQVGATNIQGGSGINVDASASTLALSGGTVNLVTPDDSSATGSISIHSGASSTTASGNVSVDTGNGIVTGTVLRDDTFETDLDGINPWSGLGTTAVQNCTVAHTGSCSMAVNGSSFWSYLQDGAHSITVTAGHHFFLSVWVKGATGGAKMFASVIWGGPGIGFDTLKLSSATITSSAAGWTQMTATGVAPAGATNAIFEGGSPDGSTSNGTQYFDDMVLTDLSSSSAVSELDLGATNAQILTLGNMNEIGTTTINGGSGIDLNSGAADLDLTGGAININGSGASTLATSYGSLTVSATATSDWGLGVANNSDGGSLVVHAGAGTGGSTHNGGNLTLMAGAASVTGSGAGGSVQIGINTTKQGYTAIGANHDSNAENAMSAEKITPTSNGTIIGLSFYVGNAGSSPNNKFQLAIYADGAACGTLTSCPGSLIVQTPDQTVVPNSWNNVSIDTGVTGGTSYWLAWNNNALNGTDNEGYYDTTGTGNHINVTGQAYGAWPGTFPTIGASTNTNSISIYANEYISGGGAGYALTSNYIGQSAFNNDVTVNSTGSQAFQVQDATGATLLTANTTSMTLTVKALVISTNLTVNGHIITGGAAPSIAAGAASCTTPTVSINGNDTSGTIAVTTGTGCTAGGQLATVTFNQAFAATPKVNITANNSAAATLATYVDGAATTMASFALGTNTTPAPSTTYQWNYWIIQ